MGSKVRITRDTFGEFRDPVSGQLKPVYRFTFHNEENNGITLQVINYGVAITSLKMPDKDGQVKDIVLGFDDMSGYLSEANPYFGATIGRVSNRIGNGKFTIDGVEYQVSLNDGPNSLHGGIRGFDKNLWEATLVEGEGEGEEVPKVVFSLLSVDGDQGYPGALIAQVTYQLLPDNQLLVDYQAMGSQTTPVALTNHSYFNLAGDDQAHNQLQGHFIHLNADEYTPVDDNLITTGEIAPVRGTKFDLTATMNDLGALLIRYPEGYDHNFSLNVPSKQKKELHLAGRVQHPSSGRMLEIHTDQPGLQFYSGNFLPDPARGELPVVGKGGAEYWYHGAFCAETQNYPNAVNHANFPNPFLRPGQTYTHSVVYKMSWGQ